MSGASPGLLLTVTTVSDELRAGIADPRIFRFKMLPFLAIQAGHPWVASPPPGTRITAFTTTTYALAWAINRLLLEADHIRRIRAVNGNRWAVGRSEAPAYTAWIDDKLDQLPLVENVRIAHPSVLGLSLQLRQGRVLDEDDIVSITMRVASRAMPVVVAAGNWGTFGEGTLSPLAALPWVIAVGATSDEAGTRRLPVSSIGRRGDEPGRGVTVVAYGENAFVPGTYGSSYAVGRALAQVLTLTAFLLQIRRVDETERTGLLGGVPLLQRFQVDTGFTGHDPKPSLPLPMLPMLGVNQLAVRASLELLRNAGFTGELEPAPAVVRQMLIDSARPMPEHQTFEVGAGFVSDQTTLAYLRRFDGLALAELFVKPASRLELTSREELQKHKLANDAELGSLQEVARRSSLSYAIDFRTGEIHASVRDPSMRANETGFTKEDRPYVWPPALD